MKFRVWCLDRDDAEDDGTDVVRGEISQVGASRRRFFVYALSGPAEAAERYADWFHGNRDGWESSWPLTFRVRSEDGTEQDFEVDREMVPEFSARPVKEKRA